MVCDTVYRFCCDESKVLPGYLELALNAPTIVDAIDKHKAGISESGVSLTHDKLGSVLIPVPSIEQQAIIVVEVDRCLSIVSAAETQVSQNLARASRLRQSVLAKAFGQSLEPEGVNMAFDFPFVSSFNKDTFNADVLHVWRSRKYDEGIDDALREHGLRYVIQAPHPMTLDDVSRVVREVMHPEFGVEPLFEDFEDSPVPKDLRVFYLARLRGVVPSDLTQNPYEVAYALKGRMPVLKVEPDLVYTSFLTASGSGSAAAPLSPIPAQNLADKGWALRNIRAEAALQLLVASGTRPGQGISVGHLDTGWTDHDDVDQSNFDHPRAMDYIVRGSTARDALGYVGNPGHGTKTASVIISRGGISAPGSSSGTTPPGKITGVATHATYVPIRCIMSVVVIFNGDVARALRYATAKRCDVASMSIGGRPMRALRKALADAVKNDVLVVCAAGNNVGLVVWPARYPDALAIAASNILDGHWPGSSKGKRVDISAPGEDVWKADPDPAEKAVSVGSGTSYATAHVAGAAALWLSYCGKAVLQRRAHAQGVSLQELFRQAVKISARVPLAWDSKNYGNGILNVEDLLQSNPLIATHGVAPSENSDMDVDLDAAALIAPDDPASGMQLLGDMFRLPGSRVSDMLAVFGHELANLLLDNPVELNDIRAAVRSENKTRALFGAGRALLDKASATLRLSIGSAAG